MPLNNSKQSKPNGLLSNVVTGSQELVVLRYAIVCLHPSVSLNSENICRYISEGKEVGDHIGVLSKECI